MFSRFDQQVVALTVVTNVANTWFIALALADRLVVAQRNLADAEQTLAVIRGRLDAGTANALDVAQQESLVAGERATIPALRNQLEQALIGLGILVGRPPEAITARPGSLNNLALPPVAPGLPSSVLQRRPDVAEAEALLVAANFDIKVARAAFFPSIQLTGSYGFSNAALNTLFTPGGTIISIAAGLAQPLFDGGLLRGQLEQAKGRYDELLANYRKAVVQAFTDVEDAPDRVALHHRTGGAAASGSGNGAAGSQYRTGTDAGRHRRCDRGAASGDNPVQRRGPSRAGAAGTVPGAAQSLQGAGRRLDCAERTDPGSVPRPAARAGARRSRAAGGRQRPVTHRGSTWTP